MDRAGHRRAAGGADRPAASAARARRWLKLFAGGKQVRPMLSGCRGKPSTRHDVRRERDLAHPVIVTTRSEEHTSELQSLMRISYAVFCLKKKKTTLNKRHQNKKPVNKTN